MSDLASFLYKITKGRRNDEPIAVFSYVVELAAMGLSADQGSGADSFAPKMQQSSHPKVKVPNMDWLLRPISEFSVAI